MNKIQGKIIPIKLRHMSLSNVKISTLLMNQLGTKVTFTFTKLCYHFTFLIGAINYIIEREFLVQCLLDLSKKKKEKKSHVTSCDC